MITRTVNLTICVALVCSVLCGCGRPGRCSATPPTPIAGAFEAGEFQHIISYGQSLSLGERAVNRWPIDLAIPPEQDVGLMFASGVIPRRAMNELIPFADSTSSTRHSSAARRRPATGLNTITMRRSEARDPALSVATNGCSGMR